MMRMYPARQTRSTRCSRRRPIIAWSCSRPRKSSGGHRDGPEATLSCRLPGPAASGLFESTTAISAPGESARRDRVRDGEKVGAATGKQDAETLQRHSLPAGLLDRRRRLGAFLRLYLFNRLVKLRRIRHQHPVRRRADEDGRRLRPAPSFRRSPYRRRLPCGTGRWGRRRTASAARAAA